MSQFFQIHAQNPQARLVNQAVGIIEKGGLVIFPTDCGYALGCHLNDKSALDRIKRLRKLDDKHNFTLVCKDLSDIGTYAKINNQQYRLLKNYTPGAYTFILKATSEVPKRLLHPKRRTIGIRVPDNAIALAIMEALGEPIMSTSLILPEDTLPLTDPYEIRDVLQHEVDLVIDGGYCHTEPTSVINLVEDAPQVIRQGAGDINPFL